MMLKSVQSLSIAIASLICIQVGAKELVDPTKPKNFAVQSTDDTTETPSSNSIKLSAVFIKSKGKYAIINGQTVAEGQSWNGFELTRVHAGGIVLKNQDGEKAVLVNYNSIKKDASNDF